MKKENYNVALEEARKRLSRETSYTVKIPNYVIEHIKDKWEPILAQHKCAFTPEMAIRAIVRCAADDIIKQKIGLDIPPKNNSRKSLFSE